MKSLGYSILLKKYLLTSDHYMRYIVDIGDMLYLLEDGQIKPLSLSDD
jgi:hypothetical protein